MIDLTDYIVEFKDNKLRVQEVVINAFNFFVGVGEYIQFCKLTKI